MDVRKQNPKPLPVTDPLRAPRGIFHACAISFPIWVVICVAVVIIFHYVTGA